MYAEPDDADVYTNGDLNISSAGLHIYGSGYAQGDIDFAGCVNGDLWAYGYVHTGSSYVGIDCNDPSVTYPGGGDITASTGDIQLQATWASGVCTAGTTFTTRGGGARSSRCKATGPGPYTAAPDAIAYQPSGRPPQIAMPEFTYNASDWAGYTVNTYTSCTAARAFILSGTWTGNQLVRIASTCRLQFANNSNVTLRGNLAIITDGSFETVNRNTWQSQAGSEYTLYIIRPYAALTCGTSTPSTLAPYDIRFSNNTTFANMKVFAYTPCAFLADNNSTVSGQFVAGSVAVSNRLTLNFIPMTPPGFVPTGYTVSPQYVREIVA
jgi:hypothetical protein